MNYYFKSVLVLLLFFCWGVHVKSQFTLSGEMRPRSEYRHGFQSLSGPDDDPAFFISQRSRLNVNFNESALKFGLSLQDIRVWGEVPQLNRSDANSSIHEAWAELKLGEKTHLKLGRQELIYDDSRIFGNVDWAQQGRSHDLAVLKISGESGLQFHAGFAFNQSGEHNIGTSYTLANSYKTMQYAWLNRKADNFQFSLLFLNNGMEDNDENNFFSQTFGGRTTFQPSGYFGLESSAYLQTGKLVSGRDLGAWYLMLAAWLKPADNLRVDAGLEILSGTPQRDGTTGKSKSFTPLYGTNHKFNGHMDYFYVGNHINNVGLVDLFATFDYSKNRFSAGLMSHIFLSQAGLVNPDDTDNDMPRFLGVELDLYAGYRLNEFSVLRFGYSKMFASESMEVLKGGSRSEPNHWAWAMVIIRPVFFKITNN